MWKKNKLPIFLLAVVAMLSIFYIYSDNRKEEEAGGDDIIDGETTNAVFAEARLQLLAERDENIRAIEATIAAGNLSEAEIAQQIALIDQLYNLKYSEIELENSIMAMGYDDAFVVVSGTDIKIDILTDEFTTAEFVSVALAAKEKFTRYHAVKIVITNPSD